MPRLVELRSGRAGLLGSGVVAAADAAVLLSIEQARDAAEAQAKAVVAAAQTQAAAMTEAARLAGLEAGTATIQDRLVAIETNNDAAFASRLPRLTGLCLEITRSVLGTFDDAELVRRIAVKALRVAARRGTIRLHVAPAHAETLHADLKTLPEAFSLQIEVIPDERITDQGCILETENGMVDATLQSQFAAIRRGMEKVLGESREEKANS